MPTKNGIYVSPTWRNTKTPTIGETELDIVSAVVQESQIQIGDRIVSMNSTKTNYLLCDGTTISRADYPDLVTVLTHGIQIQSVALPIETSPVGNVFIRAL